MSNMRHILTVFFAMIMCVGCASQPRPVHVWLDRGEYPQPIILPAGTVFKTPDGERYELKGRGALLSFSVLTLIMSRCAEILQEQGEQEQELRFPRLEREM